MDGIKVVKAWNGLGLLAAIAAYFVFAGSVNELKHFPRKPLAVTMEVRYSPIVQLLMSGGDRYLAANIDVMRSVMLPVEDLNVGNASILASIQQDAASFNPYHEDNYYVAEAVLPWYEQVSAANAILDKATEFRSFDLLPPFFRGFNAMHFERNYTVAGKFFAESAQRTPDLRQRNSLLALSAKLYEKGDDPDFAISVLQGMQSGTRDNQLKEFLQIRIIRLQMLKFIRAAASKYEEKFHKRPAALDELVTSGIVAQLPQDPLGVGFSLKNGIPVIKLNKKDN